MRNVALHLFIFALPFLFYAAYILVLKWRRREEGPRFDEAPWTALFTIGLVLAGASLVYVALATGDPAGGDYRPARIEDGRIVPGEVEPRAPEAAPAQP